jgi:hypothetical protein
VLAADSLGHGRERPEPLARVLERAVVADGDLVALTAPLAHQPRAGRGGVHRLPLPASVPAGAGGFGFLGGHPRQLLLRRVGQATVAEFLEPVRQAADHVLGAVGRGVGAEQGAPPLAQRLQRHLPQCRNLL